MIDRLTYKSDEERRAHCLRRGIDPSQHCCLDMAWFASQPVEAPGPGPNPVILYVAEWDEYRISIPREGWASTLIRFCPWCGARLPHSKEDLWRTTLAEMGYDPSEEEIPEEFRSDQWWRERGIKR
jgi:hypothetical protein